MARHGSFWGPVRAVARLKWALVVGGARGTMQNKVQLGISVTVSFVFGAAAMLGLSTVGQMTDVSGDVLAVVLSFSVIGVGLLAAATGVEASLDPRQLASEPLSSTQLGLGMLVSAVFGPPAILASMSGIGLFLGWRTGRFGDDLVLFAVVVAWWVTLVLLSRTTANMLGMWATGRFRQLAQAGAAVAGLAGWFIAHLITRYQDRWNADGLHTVAEIARWTPPGQLAVAVTGQGTDVVVAFAFGVVWLPVLVWGSIRSTARLITVAPVITDGRSSKAGLQGLWKRLGFITAYCPGPVGALAMRSVVTKLRTPRQLVNTVTALIVGAGVMVIGPLLDGGVKDHRAILLGGLVQFAVLFDGNNSFGVDGPALWSEIQAGCDARTLVRAKALASVITVGPFAIGIPLILAAMSGGWKWIPAALCIAVAAVLSAAGVAAFTSTFAPVAMPASANPLAAGDTGQGCLASIMLAIGITMLVVAAAPFIVLIYLASSRSVIISTLLAAVSVGGGILALWVTTSWAQRQLRGRESLLVTKVTPKR